MGFTQSNHAGYAVFDLETTGLGNSARIVEMAVVYLDYDGNQTGEWTTLFNPGRDVGASHIHGILSKHVKNAPSFTASAPWIMRSLAGRTLVAHNAPFDCQHLTNEFARAGIDITAQLPYLCTLQVSRDYLDIPHHRLADCCSMVGINIEHAHCAYDDALATSALLRHYLRTDPQHPRWHHCTLAASEYLWPTVPLGDPPCFVRREDYKPRDPGEWVKDLIALANPGGDDAASSAYFAELAKALLDRRLSDREIASLQNLVGMTGLSVAQVEQAHRRYLSELARLAWADDVVTPEEYRELQTVGCQLGIPDEQVRVLLLQAKEEIQNNQAVCGADSAALDLVLHPGERVVFTGPMAIPRNEWEERVVAAGLTVGGLTKKTACLVAYDPDSASSKARKAEQYGVPIVSEETFERAFIQYQQNNC